MWKPRPREEERVESIPEVALCSGFESSWDHGAREVFFLNVCLHTTWVFDAGGGQKRAGTPEEATDPRREHWSPGTGIIDGCDLPSGCWESNPLEMQPVLRTTEKSLQSPICFIIMCIHLCLLECSCLQRSEDPRIPWSWCYKQCQPPDMGARNQTQIFSKNKCS